MAVSSGYPDTKLFIDGIWREAQDDRTIPVIDPATAETIGTVAHASQADLDDALDAAERGFRIWSATGVFERYRTMRRAAGYLRERADRIAWIMTREQGKPLSESRAETLAAADIVDWFAEEGRRAYGQIIPARTSGVLQMALKLPVGPAAAFTPWNFPVNQVVRKISAALAAGCSCIVKAPEETPASPAELIRAFADAGVPGGALNLVFGDPAEISGYLIPHPVIRKISFTGSTQVGKELAALAGRHMKRSTMELGGHAPAIVLDDADIDKAVAVLAAAKFRNAGQVCIAPTRFLVQAGAYPHFLDAFRKSAQTIRLGNGLTEGVQMGPLANERRVSALETLIGDAVARGAKLVSGGHRTGNRGNFFEPTIIADVPTDARIMNEEPFGPVAIVNRFAALDEAVAEANRLPFGLASYAFTASAGAIHQLGVRIDAGMTAINQNGLALPEVPFGGVRDSGFGQEGGAEAIDGYLVTKFVTQTSDARTNAG